MMAKTEVSGGMGFFEVLTVVFIVLKLCNVIDWSWWWVLSPAILLLVLIVIFLIAYVYINRRRTK